MSLQVQKAETEQTDSGRRYRGHDGEIELIPDRVRLEWLRRDGDGRHAESDAIDLSQNDLPSLRPTA